MSTDTKPRFEDRLLDALLEHHPARTGEPVTGAERRPARSRPARSRRWSGWRLGLAGATGLAVAAAGLAAAGVFTPGSASGVPDVQTLVYRATQALNQVQPGDIQFSTTTLSDLGKATDEVALHWQRTTGQADKTVQAWRDEIFRPSPGPPGQPLKLWQDESWVYRDKAVTGHIAVYAKREWFPDNYPYRRTSSPLPSNNGNAYRQMLHNGRYYVIGKVWLHGQQTIEIARRDHSAQVWFDPRTYLIVQYKLRGPGLWGSQTYELSWLPPTRANLAKLVAPIPAGFHRPPPAPKQPHHRVAPQIG